MTRFQTHDKHAEQEIAPRRNVLLDEIRSWPQRSNSAGCHSNFAALQHNSSKNSVPGEKSHIHQGQLRYLIGRSGDRYEQEANHIAENFMQSKSGFTHTDPDPGSQQVTPLTLSSVLPCSLALAADNALQQARLGGSPLDTTSREAMGQIFPNDLGNINIHNDARSDCLNHLLNAQAVTIGHDIFFRRGMFNTATQTGQGLLAHELTHVRQQCQSGTCRQVIQCSPSDDFSQALDERSEEARLARLNTILRLLDIDDLAGAETLYTQLTEATLLHTRFETGLPRYHAEVLNTLFARIRILREERNARVTSRDPRRRENIAAALGNTESLALSQEFLEQLSLRRRGLERVAGMAPPADRPRAVATDVQAHREQLHSIIALSGVPESNFPGTRQPLPAPETMPPVSRPSGQRETRVTQRAARTVTETGREQQEATRRAVERNARRAETARPSQIEEERLVHRNIRNTTEAGREQQEAIRREVERNASRAETTRPSQIRQAHLELRNIRTEPEQLFIPEAIRMDVNRQELERANRMEDVAPEPLSRLAATSIVDMLIGMIPIVGDLVDIAEFTFGLVTGEDRWGRPLTALDLALIGIGVLIPYVGGSVLRGGAVAVRRIDEVAGLAENVGRTSDEVTELLQRTGRLTDAEQAQVTQWISRIQRGQDIPENELSEVQRILGRVDEGLPIPDEVRGSANLHRNLPSARELVPDPNVLERGGQEGVVDLDRALQSGLALEPHPFRVGPGGRLIPGDTPELIPIAVGRDFTRYSIEDAIDLVRLDLGDDIGELRWLRQADDNNGWINLCRVFGVSSNYGGWFVDGNTILLPHNASLVDFIHELVHAIGARHPQTLDDLGPFLVEGITEAIARSRVGPHGHGGSYLGNVQFAVLLAEHLGTGPLERAILQGESNRLLGLIRDSFRTNPILGRDFLNRLRRLDRDNPDVTEVINLRAIITNNIERNPEISASPAWTRLVLYGAE